MWLIHKESITLQLTGFHIKMRFWSYVERLGKAVYQSVHQSVSSSEFSVLTGTCNEVANHGDRSYRGSFSLMALVLGTLLLLQRLLHMNIPIQYVLMWNIIFWGQFLSTCITQERKRLLTQTGQTMCVALHLFLCLFCFVLCFFHLNHEHSLMSFSLGKCDFWIAWHFV